MKRLKQTREINYFGNRHCSIYECVQNYNFYKPKVKGFTAQDEQVEDCICFTVPVVTRSSIYSI